MNPRHLVDHIRSGPAELVLDEPLRFRRRTRSNPCDFNDFIQALQSSETIRAVNCESHRILCITEDEWVLLVKTLGRIRDIHNLILYCMHGSRNFHPFQVVADAVNNAQSLRELEVVLNCQIFPRDPSGLTALANTLREHTGLQEFTLFDFCPLLETAQSTALDPVLQALLACPHLQLVFVMTEFASADAIRNLLQLPTVTRLSLTLTPKQWLAVADEIRLGRYLIKKLNLDMFLYTSSEATEAVKAVASAIREDRHLESLVLRMEDGFTDEAGVALAEAVTMNRTLCILLLEDLVYSDPAHPNASLGAQAFEAFGAMLRVNTSIKLHLPTFDDAVGDERDMEHFNQMCIEHRLNEAGRGRVLVSNQTPREDWVNALQELNAPNDDDAFKVSCLYSLLRLNPSVCLLELNDTTNFGL
jgi:hypothetical protein